MYLFWYNELSFIHQLHPFSKNQLVMIYSCIE